MSLDPIIVRGRLALDLANLHGVDFAKFALGSEPAPAPSPTVTAEPTACSPRRRTRLKDLAWAEILDALDKYGKTHKLPTKKLLIEFREAYNTRLLSFPEWVVTVVPSFCMATLNRRRAKRRGGAKRFDRPASKRILERDAPQVLIFVDNLLVDCPQMGPSDIFRAVQREFPRCKLPSLRTFQRLVSERVGTRKFYL